MPDKQPRPASHFRLRLDGRETVGMFRECTGMDSENDVIEQKAVDENGQPVVRKISGAVKWSNIQLKRGVDENAELWKWRDQVIKEGPDPTRCDGTIELVDYTGSAIATFQFKQGWPIKYAPASLNAESNEVAVEEIHIAHEGLERM
ncbi:MAG TPA: phage tail protein [Solirubrobacterales bacterium]|nr:phage tail protein [Solirubrobacterales bacterium]